MKLSCAIIDDEPLAVELIKSYVAKTPFLELKGAYYSALSAFEKLREEPVELLFCDIQMPNLSGMELAHILPKETKVVFTTAFDRYAVEGFKVNALDYLLKPIDYSDFLTAAQRALEWFEGRKSAAAQMAARPKAAALELKSIFVKSEYKLVQIDLDKILYIEGLKDYVKIYLEEQSVPVLSLMTLKSLEAMLPAERFARVHRSFIVQYSKIGTIERNRIIFGKTYIPISEGYRENFFATLASRSLLPKT